VTPAVCNAIVIAAGRGERLMPLSAETPKPLVACPDGRSMLETQIDWLHGFADRVHVTVGYRKDMVAAAAIAAGAASVTIVGSRGNAAWIGESTLGLLDEPVVVVTADNLMSIDLDGVVDEFGRLDGASGMLVCVDPPGATAGDRVESEHGVVTDISHMSNDTRVASGLQVLNPARVREATAGATEFSEIWSQLVQKGTLYVSERSPSRWIAVDRPEDLRDLALWNLAFDPVTGR
jgi:NDP-sugar pyrophosphorylase family protein